jgi:predicted nucleic acid-binding protein
MARYCIDASALLTWLFQPNRPAVDAFWQELAVQDELIAAPLLRPECTAAIRQEVFDRRMDHERSQALLRRLIALPLTVIDSLGQFPRANDLAHQFQHRKAYDMQYLAVAEIAEAELVTADRGLRHAAEAIGVQTRFLA